MEMTENNMSVVASDLKKFIEEKKLTVSHLAYAPTIPRVPYEFNENYYNPSTAPIGPYHALQLTYGLAIQATKLGSKDRIVSEMKSLRLMRFLERLRPDLTEETLIERLTQLEPDIRRCYAQDISYDFSISEFLEIMLLDGCFIVELLSSRRWNEYERLMAKSGNINLYDLEMDLLKPGNQLPFLLLESLFELIQHDDTSCSLANHALFFFGDGVLRQYKLHHVSSAEISSHSIKHLLHLVMIALFPSPGIPIRDLAIRGYITRTSASELEACGIKFRKRENSFIPDVVFRNGVLEIPALVVDESTASLLSNLLATEMFCVEEGQPRMVASYVVFLNCLINNVEDFQVLCRAGIFQCRVSDPIEIVSLFRILSANAFMDMEDFIYADHLSKMHNYCISFGPRVRAYLKRAYRDWDAFNGVLLFILTFTQTLFSILGYSPPSKKKQ